MKIRKKKEAPIWVDLGYATCGITIIGNKVVGAAPIMKWAKGKRWHDVRRWIEQRGRWKPIV
jgi:hypothetical protein